MKSRPARTESKTVRHTARTQCVCALCTSAASGAIADAILAPSLGAIVDAIKEQDHRKIALWSSEAPGTY